NATPLLRQAVIATEPLEEYHFSKDLQPHYKQNKIRGFLIDGNVFGGSSGSLVILKSQYVQMYDEQIHLSLQKAVPYVLGIVTTSYPSINSRDKDQKLGLGGVLSAELIIETIEEFK